METLQPLHDVDPGDISDEDEIVLPWWRNPLNLIAILVATAILAASSGFIVGERSATPRPNAVDVGFLQDMRTHHEQAVEMSLVFMSKPDTDAALRTIAREIVFGQGIDIGRMIQLLRDFGKPEANESGTAMTWMNESVPEARMPGMASGSDQETLLQAEGTRADAVFAALMIAHHHGGIHMADYAATNAATAEVRQAAADMSSGQVDEIKEIQGLQIVG